MQTTVYLNNQWVAEDQAKVSAFDRGFMFGDGVYEVIPVYNRCPFALDEHLTRLNTGLTELGIPSPHTDIEWQAIFQRLVADNSVTEGLIYLQVTRGVAPFRHHDFIDDLTPTVFASIKAANVGSDTGITCVSLDDIRWSNGHIKAITLLGSVLLRQQAKAQGADDALLFRGDYLTEATAANVFVIKGDQIKTPPLSHWLLGGITRKILIDALMQANLSVVESEISRAEVKDADEIWITSTTKEVAPVIKLDGAPVGMGEIGPVWQQASLNFTAYKERLLKPA